MIVGATQLFGLGTFSFIYDDSKTRPLGGAVRIAGTMGNPNIFAWFVIQMSVIVLLFEKRKLPKLFAIIVAAALVLFSGSRTFLMLFPVILIFVQIISYKRGSVFYLFKLPLFALLSYGIYLLFNWFVFQIRYSFPYLYQLSSFLETGDLTTVNSFHERTLMWDSGLEKLGDSWFFGLGPGTIHEMDNDFLYIIVNYGVIYLAIHLIMYLIIIVIFSKVGNRKFSTLGIQYVIFALIVGLQADTLVGWTYPIFILFLTGIAISMIKRRRALMTSH